MCQPHRIIRNLLLLVVLMMGQLAHAQTASPKYQIASFLFEENKGQFDDRVLFRSILPNGFLFLERDGFTYLFENEKDKSELMKRFHEYNFIGPRPEIILHQHSIRIRFLNATNQAVVMGEEPENYHTNYFKGNNPNLWQTGVKSYKKVKYSDVYPGIDLIFYTSENGFLKYDWYVHAGSKPGDIQLKYEGQDSMFLKNDRLHVITSVNSLIEDEPIMVNPNLHKDHLQIAGCQFVLKNNILSFKMPGDWFLEDVIIDPKLIFSTYSGSRGDNFGFTATYDSRGNLYAGGIVNGEEGPYPVSTGAVQVKYGGGQGREPAYLPCDISISKYDSAGNNLLWATYLGGVSDDYPHSLVTDQDDDLLVFGTTYSNDFPTTKGAYDETYNGASDIIVSKISENGLLLIGSTYIGGSGLDGLNGSGQLRHNYADDFRGDIIPDEDKNIFVASCTESKDFPLVNPIDTSQSLQEGVILELNEDLTQLIWSTFLGGTGHDALYSIKVDSDSSIYVGGGTASNDLKKFNNVLNNSYLGSIDGFVAKLDRKNKRLTKLSYWGTPKYDQVYFIDLDFKGHVFIAGQTHGNIEPTTGVYGTANRGQFIAKLDTSLDKIIWQTSFGVKPNAVDISPSAFLIDNCEHIYVSGWGSNVNPDLNPGSTTGLETTPDALQKTTDGNDFYIIVLNKDATSLLYATYFGGDTTDDHVDGGTSRFDKKGVVYQSVCSSCPSGSEPGHQDFPVTPNAAFTVNYSPRCSNASFKIDLQIRSAVDAYFIPDPVIGCIPLTVNFLNKSDIVSRFIWDFGDGTKDSINLNPNHTYTQAGDYIISLTVIDSNSCNFSDVFHRTISVLGSGKADFEYELKGCSPEVKFTTKSEGLAFKWYLGDGDSAEGRTFTHIYPPGGTYDVWLYVNPGTLCADSIMKTVNTAEPGKRNVLIPNVFTPNNDGINDQYCLEGFVPNCDEIELFIYSRWGELAFKTNNITECWNGKVKGKNIDYPSGTYFYLLKAFYGDSGNEETTSGTITLIRD